jgi:hypothetical protein
VVGHFTRARLTAFRMTDDMTLAFIPGPSVTGVLLLAGIGTALRRRQQQPGIPMINCGYRTS